MLSIFVLHLAEMLNKRTTAQAAIDSQNSSIWKNFALQAIAEIFVNYELLKLDDEFFVCLFV